MRFLPPHPTRYAGSALGVALLCLLGSVSAAKAKGPADWLPSSVSTGTTVSTPGSRGTGSLGPKLRVRTKSIYEMRWEGVVRQQAEIGCAAASLATVLTYFFDLPIDEETLVTALSKEAEADAKARNYRVYGFNLKHIRNVAAGGNIVGRAFRIKAEDLAKLKIPAITRVTIKGYDHFVVLRGAQDGHVFVADPAFGNTSYRLRSFEKIWSGVVMAFLRRNGLVPPDHELLVKEDDERYAGPSELMRFATAAPAPLGYATEAYGAIPITPLPPIPGLESVLPIYLYHRVEF